MSTRRPAARARQQPLGTAERRAARDDVDLDPRIGRDPGAQRLDLRARAQRASPPHRPRRRRSAPRPSTRDRPCGHRATPSPRPRSPARVHARLRRIAIRRAPRAASPSPRARSPSSRRAGGGMRYALYTIAVTARNTALGSVHTIRRAHQRRFMAYARRPARDIRYLTWTIGKQRDELDHQRDRDQRRSPPPCRTRRRRRRGTPPTRASARSAGSSTAGSASRRRSRPSSRAAQLRHEHRRHPERHDRSAIGNDHRWIVALVIQVGTDLRRSRRRR